MEAHISGKEAVLVVMEAQLQVLTIHQVQGGQVDTLAQVETEGELAPQAQQALVAVAEEELLAPTTRAVVAQVGL